jgi:hypothetical protein
MDIAFLPFAASVLAEAFRDGHGQRTVVVFHGITFEVAAILFNVIWWYVRHDRRLLTTTIDSAGVRAISRRFQLALVWIATGNTAGRPATRSRPGRDRGVRPVLLAANRG